MPLTILTAVPLCAGGAFGALLLTQNMLSLPALIGLLMLIGIASKNSILLVDYAVMAEDEHGLSQHDALIDACRKRAQPVIMTTLAMGAGRMPIALGFSGDSSRSEEHTSELQSLMRTSYAAFCLKKKTLKLH